jgi:Ni/Co efflux regulator RcnB
MKKILLSAAIAAMTFVGGAASAQGYYGGYDRYDRGYDSRYRYDSDGDGRSDAREWNRDRDRDGRPDQYDRYDNRRDWRHDSYRGHNRWRQGQVYPYWRQRGYVIEDYRAYRLPPPRHGYRYYRSDNGDVVLAAIASGVIAAIIADQHDNDRHDRRYYGR